MSDGAPHALVIEEFKEILVDGYVAYSVTAMAVYEYLLTTRHEYAFLFRRRWTGATWLFLTNRYVMLAIAIWQTTPSTASTCHFLWIPYDVLGLFPKIIAAVFSALRVYALLDRNLLISVVVLLLSLVTTPVEIYNMSQSSSFFLKDPILGAICIGDTTITQQHDIYFSAATFACTSTADLIVILATWNKTFRHTREASRLGMGVNVSSTLLRDGSMYFIAILILDVLGIVQHTVPSLDFMQPIVAVTMILQPIIISRFLINLREADGGPQGTTSISDAAHFSRFSAPGFRVPTLDDVIGNLGESVEYDRSERSDMTDEGDSQISAEEASSKRMSQDACDVERTVMQVP